MSDKCIKFCKLVCTVKFHVYWNFQFGIDSRKKNCKCINNGASIYITNKTETINICKLRYDWIIFFFYFKKYSFTVSEYGFGLYENFQFDMYDVVNRSLEWLFTIFSANVARFSLKLMGIDKWITGIYRWRWNKMQF